MLNKSVLMGRFVADPKLKHTSNQIAVTNFTLAVNRPKLKDKEQQADFIDIVAWRGTAEFICKFFKKGMPIIVVGALQSRIWKDKEGKSRKNIELVADEAIFAEPKKNSEGKTDDDIQQKKTIVRSE